MSRRQLLKDQLQFELNNLADFSEIAHMGSWESGDRYILENECFMFTGPEVMLTLTQICELTCWVKCGAAGRLRRCLIGVHVGDCLRLS